MKPGKSKRQTRATGAPPPHFLLALNQEPLLKSLLERGRDERKPYQKQTTNEIAKSAALQILELADRVFQPRMTSKGLENAAQNLAAIATLAANLLEDLAKSSIPEVCGQIRLAAGGRNMWPVNLRLGGKRGRKDQSLEGADNAKDYLIGIGLGACSPPGMKHVADATASPSRRAAELLMQGLLDWKNDFARRGQTSGWSERLLEVRAPMTTDNQAEWWAVAKQWMDEYWDPESDYFRPLIKHLDFVPGRDTPSLIKRRVIDDSLKKAFLALAVRPAE